MVQAIATALQWVVIGFCGIIVGLILLGGVLVIIESFRQRKRFSLNPDWDATRDFIDAIPTKKGK